MGRPFLYVRRVGAVDRHRVGQLGPQVVTYRTARDRRWARGSQGSASPWDRLWASYPPEGTLVFAGERTMGLAWMKRVVRAGAREQV